MNLNIHYHMLVLDVETCARCGRPLKVIASIELPAVIKTILTHLDKTTHRTLTCGSCHLPRAHYGAGGACKLTTKLKLPTRRPTFSAIEEQVMAHAELHIAATAGWRALLTHAQLAAGVRVTPAVEEHLVSLLFRHVGSGITTADLENGFVDRIDRILHADTSDPAVVGDQCLLFAGLFPEHAIAKGVPVSYFVEVGRQAYREYASKHKSEIHAALADGFVRAMDTLQTLRVLQSGEPCIDGFNAYNLWHELGSAHGWRMLRSMTKSLPASCGASQHVH